MYKIIGFDKGGFRYFLNHTGFFMAATNSVWSFVSVANASYSYRSLRNIQTTNIDKVYIEGPRGGLYNVETCRKLRTKF